jgi:hypothetical protein
LLHAKPQSVIMSPQNTVKDAVVVKCMHLPLSPFPVSLAVQYTNKCI